MMKTFLVTAAAGDTGAATVKFLRESGHKVRALVRRDDERAEQLRALGAGSGGRRHAEAETGSRGA
ncbi:NmrA family NAD(P)-binding protein [Ewingella americana]